MKKILITGALGQIGSELTMKLRHIYGNDNIVATDIKKSVHEVTESGPFETLDVTDGTALFNIATHHQVDTIIHLAALLSARAEANPLLAWHINMKGIINALETSKERKCQFFTPSSIGAFGPTTPKNSTPQDTMMRPTTMYGINKLTGELLAEYYFLKYNVDTRGLRFPGLISYMTPPGGGTTDYAVEIFHDAIKFGHYTCYLNKGTMLDMMYMPDALQAIIDLMEANPDQLIHRNAYNVTGMSFAPEEIATEIQKHIPGFTISYQIDAIRQAIADSWPNCIDATTARKEWGFKPSYDLARMTIDMLEKLNYNRPIAS